MSNDDRIPIIETYRGIGLHDQQTPRRLEVVRRAIDDVFTKTDSGELTRIAGDVRWPPEARKLAAALLQAEFEIAVDERRERPSIDLDRVAASVAGIDSKKWRDPIHFASLLDRGWSAGEEGPVRRDEPLR